MDDNAVLWNDRKHTFLGLPWSFTRYSFSDSRFYVRTGFLRIQEEELMLYRVMDITLIRTLGQRIFGLGTIRMITADRTSPELLVKSIKNSEDIKRQLSDLVEKARRENRVFSREEFMEDIHDHTPDF